MESKYKAKTKGGAERMTIISTDNRAEMERQLRCQGIDPRTDIISIEQTW